MTSSGMIQSLQSVMNILRRWTGVALVLLTLTASTTARADSFAEEPTYERYFQTPFGSVRVVGFKSSTLIYRKDRGRFESVSIPLSLRGIAYVSVASFVLLVGGALLYRRRRHAHTTA